MKKKESPWSARVLRFDHLWTLVVAKAIMVTDEEPRLDASFVAWQSKDGWHNAVEMAVSDDAVVTAEVGGEDVAMWQEGMSDAGAEEFVEAVIGIPDPHGVHPKAVLRARLHSVALPSYVSPKLLKVYRSLDWRVATLKEPKREYY